MLLPFRLRGAVLLLAMAAGCSMSSSIDVARERGDVALQLGDTQDAADAYREVLAYEPGDPEALLGLARCYVSLGDGELALDVFERLDQADPEFFAREATTDFHFALYQAAKQAQRRGDSTQALRRVRRLQALDPDHGGLAELTQEVLIAEGARLQLAGRSGEAETLLREALGQGEPQAEVAASAALAGVLLDRGQTDAAISVLSDALLRHPKNPELSRLMERALEIRYPQ